jgi:hypothetical protein
LLCAIYLTRTMNKPPKTLADLLELKQFREKTPMYIGDWTITSLKAFIDGYLYASWVKEMDDEDTVRFGKFHDYVANYFGWFDSTAGWKNIILKESNGDEEKALKKFFELYDLFKVR